MYNSTFNYHHYDFQTSFLVEMGKVIYLCGQCANFQEDDEENEEEGEGGETDWPADDHHDVMVSRNLLAAFLEEDVPQSSKRRAWDDEFVLKRQFSALIPAFDPRPGRTNINQVI